MVRPWLDAARYSDTNRYNNDTPRYNWRYRDWVIQALNRNMRYDQFVTEQLAGDLLPKPTVDQLVASGFNRNHNVTSEGGIIDEVALASAIAGGTIAGAAIDVYAVEPTTESPLFALSQVVVTPHLGASTHEAQHRAGASVVEAVVAALDVGR